MKHGMDQNLMKVLAGETIWPPPLWLMRQAGRYLPEYRAVRAEAGTFLDLCFSPRLACEVTLQPIRRFGFDAAIIFSDILVVPLAMGRHVRFESGEGPLVEAVRGQACIDGLLTGHATDRLQAIYDAIAMTRRKLPVETTLIGFCGGPWTVATYMIAGRGKDEQAAAKAWAYQQPQLLDQLIAKLVDVSWQHLARQLQAGAQAVQIFETWGGALDGAAFERFVIQPTREIVRRVREAVPGARIIGFPRGAASMLRRYSDICEVDAVGFDWSLDPAWVRREIAKPLQGNLDPLRLVAGRAAIDAGLEGLLPAMQGKPYVFNLGHGITPEARIEDVAYVVDRVRRWI